MKTVIVAVGSTRRPKLNAVWEALTVFGPSLDQDALFEVEGVDVPSGVHHTPRSRAECMSGARNRADALVTLAREDGKLWDYFVGLEGGLEVVEEVGASCVFLQNWAYVTDGSGEGYFGQSGAVLMPPVLAARVLEDGVELAEAVDAFAGSRGIRDGQGAWGVLTRNFITRQDSFRLAAISAFAPYYNAYAFRKS
jgi:inosine/xanthosine triphosphatase